MDEHVSDHWNTETAQARTSWFVGRLGILYNSQVNSRAAHVAIILESMPTKSKYYTWGCKYKSSVAVNESEMAITEDAQAEFCWEMIVNY